MSLRRRPLTVSTTCCRRRYAPHQARRGYGLQAVDVRYSYYRRSDRLAAHTLALVVEVGRVRAAPYRPAATAGAVRASINGRM